MKPGPRKRAYDRRYYTKHRAHIRRKQNERQRKLYSERRAKAILLLGGVCARCGTAEDLQFDHIDPATKTYEMSKVWACGQPTVDAEVAKCQLLCITCHGRKTRSEHTESCLCRGCSLGTKYKEPA